MINIKLKDGQTGYDVVGGYVRRYWEHNIEDDVVISMGISYDGNCYDLLKEIASPYEIDIVEFLNDWWEGEKFIKLFGIMAVSELDITGGIYEEIQGEKEY